MLPFRMSEMISGLPGFLLAGNWKKSILIIRSKQFSVLVQLCRSRKCNDESPVRYNELFCPNGFVFRTGEVVPEHCRQHRPLLCASCKCRLTADGDAQLHPSPLGQFHMKGPAAGNHRLWSGLEKQMWAEISRDPSAEEIINVHTCDIELYLHWDFIGQGGVSEQLVGFFQRAVLCWDPIDGQQSVPDLQQSTPGHKSNELVDLFLRNAAVDLCLS